MPVRPLLRFARRLLPAALIVAALAGCAVTYVPGTRTVQIERTAFDIPHITASTYEGLAYGMAYAYAQDNVCLLADHLVTVRGERSLNFGPTATGLLGLRTLPNAQIDLFVRNHMDDVALARANALLGPAAQAAVRGYIAGYNRYLKDTGADRLPAECRNAAWVTPLTEPDFARMNELSMVLAGSAALGDAIVEAAPPAKATGSVVPAEVTAQQAAAALARYSIGDRGEEGGELGSNGWAFGANATPDGRGLVLGNPHFPWIGINRMWELHLTIPGTVDVMGAVSGAGPVVSIGFNKDVAWTHTVSTGKRFTLYELTLDPADPTTYIVDGQRRKMTARTVSVPVAAGMPNIQRTLYSTQWGPVVVIRPAGITWSATTAYALADANTLNVRWLEAWMGMNRARSVEELRAAMGQQGIPWVNTIAADRAGSAMYADLSAVPDVSADMLKRCAPSPRAAALFTAAGLPVLNGSRADCAWNVDQASPTRGLTPPNRMPVLITRDWVQNSNDSYWLTNPALSSPAGISPLVGLTQTPQRLRTRSALMEISRRLAGADGLPGDKMGIDQVRGVILADHNFAGYLVRNDLVAACGTAGAALAPEQREGCEALEKWDGTSNAASRGAPLFREFWRKAKDIPNLWRVPFDPAKPVETPAGLKMADEKVGAAVFKALADAVGIVKAAGYPVDVALGDAQYRDVRGQRVTIHGGDEFEGVLNKVESQGQPTLEAGGYRINYGSSYIQAVTFDARGPIAYALLTFGQSSNPASPFAHDQLPLFSTNQWVKLPFHREDVEAQRLAPPLALSY